MTVTLARWDKAPYVFVNGDLPPDVENAIDSELSYEVQDAEFTDAWRAGEWDGRHRLFRESNEGSRYFPVGCLQRVRSVLNAFDVDYEVEGVVNPGQGDLEVAWDTEMEPREYQQDAVRDGLRHGSGIVAMPTGCHEPGTELLRYDGSTVAVEDVEVGEKLMGPDSDPRVVQDTASGESKMYRIKPVKGEPFVVTHDHKLTLVRTESGRGRGGEVIDITVEEWLESSDWFKHVHKLFRTGVEFDEPVDHTPELLPLHPYFLGILIGDGSLSEGTPKLCTDEPAVQERAAFHAGGSAVQMRTVEHTDRVTEFVFKTPPGETNPVQKVLREHDLNVKSEDKHLPHVYKTAPKSDRLQLLAGLLDTDGHLASNCFEYSSASEQLAEDVAYLARSLGLAAYVSEKETHNQHGYAGVYYKVSISGETDMIPTHVPRKQADEREQKKDVLRTGFDVESVGVGEYHGVTVDKDHRYLMSDFTVTHNSGKTLIGLRLLHRLKRPAMVLCHRQEIADQWVEKMRNILNVDVAKCYGGTRENGDFMVGLYQSIYDDDNSEVRDSVRTDHDVLIADECHRVGAQTFSQVALNINATYRYGLSATPEREDNATLRVIGGTGEMIADIRPEGLIEDGYLARPRWEILDAPRAGGSHRQWQSEYKAEIVENDARNQLIADKVDDLPKPCYVHVERINHGERLEGLIEDAKFVSSDSSDREEVIGEFRDGDRDLLISTLLGEGFDVPELRSVVMAGGLKTSIGAIQKVGRALRPGTDTAVIVDFMDNGRWVGDHSEERIRTYREYYGKKFGP